MLFLPISLESPFFSCENVSLFSFPPQSRFFLLIRNGQFFSVQLSSRVSYFLPALSLCCPRRFVSILALVFSPPLDVFAPISPLLSFEVFFFPGDESVSSSLESACFNEGISVHVLDSPFFPLPFFSLVVRVFLPLLKLNMCSVLDCTHASRTLDRESFQLLRAPRHSR